MVNKTYPIRFIKDFDMNKLGDIVECSKRDCERLIEHGYADYVETIKKNSEKIGGNSVSS